MSRAVYWKRQVIGPYWVYVCRGGKEDGQRREGERVLRGWERTPREMQAKMLASHAASQKVV